jgi:hypothetical protein
MLALAKAGDAWCASTPATTPHTTPCTTDTTKKIAKLRQRAALLGSLTQAHLWNDAVGAYTNKLPAAAYNLTADSFYARISPTSFYPMMSGTPTTAQADRLVQQHLLNPTGFCITPEDQWPKHERLQSKHQNHTGTGTVLVQSWKFPSAGGVARVVLCTADPAAAAAAATAAGNGSGAVAPCSAVQAAGASLVRNESFGWSSAGADDSRTPLYLYHLPAGNQTVWGAKDDFPAAQRVSATPVVWVAATLPQPGAWPLQLWRAATPHTSTTIGSSNETAAAAAGPAVQSTTIGSSNETTYYWRVTGSPDSENEVAQAQNSEGLVWSKNRTLGWGLPLPTACYWGLPSVSFDDPAFASPGKFVYWRGNAWAPLAMLTYWGLDHPAYTNLSSVQVARKGLVRTPCFGDGKSGSCL